MCKQDCRNRRVSVHYGDLLALHLSRDQAVLYRELYAVCMVFVCSVGKMRFRFYLHVFAAVIDKDNAFVSAFDEQQRMLVAVVHAFVCSGHCSAECIDGCCFRIFELVVAYIADLRHAGEERCFRSLRAAEEKWCPVSARREYSIACAELEVCKLRGRTF